MLDRNQLEKFKSASFPVCDISNLRDIREIKISNTKPKANRMIDFLNQAGNPYIFRVGDIAVKIEFEGGRDFSEAFVNSLCAS